MAQQSHRSSPAVLNRRTLERDHPRLAGHLRPGIAVLDVGCGTGSISAGIARLVGPEGFVLGIDRDEGLLAIAREEHRALPNLRFEQRDILAADLDRTFDLATAARVLQWIADPGRAVANMARVLRAGGELVALDYNHRDNSWDPPPPAAFARFYAAFLAWRDASGWDNSMGDRLPALFESAGLGRIQTFADDDVAERPAGDFAERAGVWSHVVESIGPAIVAAGYLSEAERESAAGSYAEFIVSRLERQTLVMRTVVGAVTAPLGT